MLANAGRKQSRVATIDSDDLTSTGSGSSADADPLTIKSEGDDDDLTTYDVISYRRESTVVRLRDAMENVSKMRKEREKMKVRDDFIFVGVTFARWRCGWPN